MNNLNQKSIFTEPKEKWKDLFEKRSLNDLVDIDFPYALSLGQITPLRLLVTHLVTTEKKIGQQDLSPKISQTIEHFFADKKNTNTFSTKKWRALVDVFQQFLPMFLGHPSFVLGEEKSAKIFSSWVEHYPKTKQAVEEAYNESRKNEAFFNTLAQSIVATIHKTPSDLKWLSFFGEEARTLLAKKITTQNFEVFQSTSGFPYIMKERLLVSPDTDLYFPELLQNTLLVHAKYITEYAKKLEGHPLGNEDPNAFQNTLMQQVTSFVNLFNQQPSSTQQFEQMINNMGNMGNSDVFKSVNIIDDQRHLKFSCDFLAELYNKNKQTLSLDKYFPLFDAIPQNKEIYALMGELGQVGQSYWSKNSLLSALPDGEAEPSQNKPRNKPKI